MMNLLVLAAVLVQPLVGLEKAERWSDAEKALYPLSEAAQAHRDLEARKTTGSTIFLP